jgi:hypothetical protein
MFWIIGDPPCFYRKSRGCMDRGVPVNWYPSLGPASDRTIGRYRVRLASPKQVFPTSSCNACLPAAQRRVQRDGLFSFHGNNFPLPFKAVCLSVKPREASPIIRYSGRGADLVRSRQSCRSTSPSQNEAICSYP